jgi:Response regulator containing CheY-like receiver domain and AraC-type DNA-binding domain
MQQKALHQPFELNVCDMESWRARPLIYHFFEIVQILDGAGTREVNRNRFPFKAGNIYLFTPLDCRGFESNGAARICSIRFSEVFLGKYRTAVERERITQWLKQLEHIFYHHNRFEELLIKEPADCIMVAALMKNMVEEYGQKQAYHEENLQHYVTLILNILARNVRQPAEQAPGEEPLINRMLVHIHRHISQPDQLRIDYLAGLFNLSANYVSEYFRKFTGESLQQYITQYKIKLVQQRLAYSTLTVSQIADELGFTDESHLGRQFRKYYGLSPAEYRKKAKLV